MYYSVFKYIAAFYTIMPLQSTTTNIYMLPNNAITIKPVFNWMHGLLTYYRNSSDYAVTLIDTEGLLNMESFIAQFPVIIYDKKYIHTDKNAIHNSPILIFLRDGYQLEDVLQLHYKTLKYTQAVPLLIAIFEASEEYVKQVFLKCYHLRILPVIILTWSNCGECWYTFDLKTMEPENRTNDYTLLNNIQNKVTADASKYDFKICIFEYRPDFMIFRDARGRISLSGVDGNALISIMRHMNATYSLVVMNNTGKETLESRENLNRNVCEMVFVAMATVPDYQGVEEMYPLYTEALCFIVPKAGEKSNAWNLVRPFQLNTWECLCISTCVLLCLWIVFFKYGAYRLQMEEEHLSILDFFGILLNLNPHVRFHHLVTSSKFFIISLVIYSFYIVYCYQGLLVGFLLKPSYNKDMNTLRDVAESGLHIYGLSSAMDKWKYRETSKGYIKQLKAVTIGMPDYGELSARLQANDISIGFLSRRKLMKLFLSSKLHNPQGIPIYHIVPECVTPTFFTYVVRHDFPYMKRFEEILGRIKQAGLQSYWDMISKYKFFEHSANKAGGPIDLKNSVALTMKHLMGIFYFWIIGIGISIFVFVSEIFIANAYHLYDPPPFEFIL